jgi:hypothetical protein
MTGERDECNLTSTIHPRVESILFNLLPSLVSDLRSEVNETVVVKLWRVPRTCMQQYVETRSTSARAQRHFTSESLCPPYRLMLENLKLSWLKDERIRRYAQSWLVCVLPTGCMLAAATSLT